MSARFLLCFKKTIKQNRLRSVAPKISHTLIFSPKYFVTLFWNVSKTRYSRLPMSLSPENLTWFFRVGIQTLIRTRSLITLHLNWTLFLCLTFRHIHILSRAWLVLLVSILAHTHALHLIFSFCLDVAFVFLLKSLFWCSTKTRKLVHNSHTMCSQLAKTHSSGSNWVKIN